MVRRGLLVAAAAIVAGCGGSGEVNAPGPARLAISGYKFPASVQAEPGESIAVTNADDEPHTVTADDETLFDVGPFEKGEDVAVTAPSKPGRYPFRCRIHPNTMKSTLVVSERG